MDYGTVLPKVNQIIYCSVSVSGTISVRLLLCYVGIQSYSKYVHLVQIQRFSGNCCTFSPQINFFPKMGLFEQFIAVVGTLIEDRFLTLSL